MSIPYTPSSAGSMVGIHMYVSSYVDKEGEKGIPPHTGFRLYGVRIVFLIEEVLEPKRCRRDLVAVMKGAC